MSGPRSHLARSRGVSSRVIFRSEVVFEQFFSMAFPKLLTVKHRLVLEVLTSVLIVI